MAENPDFLKSVDTASGVPKLVFVFDSSGSTSSCFPLRRGQPIQATYRYMAEVVADLAMELAGKLGKPVDFRVVFFSGNGMKNQSKLVPATSLDLNRYTTMLGRDAIVDPLTRSASQRCGGLTHTWRGIEAVATEPELVKLVENGANVVIVTDGHMTKYSPDGGRTVATQQAAQQECARQFRRVLDINPNTKFFVVAVQEKAVDPRGDESAVVGGDILEMTRQMSVLMRAGGDSTFQFPVLRFLVFNPRVPDGFAVIDNQELPPHHAQWGDRMFNIDDRLLFEQHAREVAATVTTGAQAMTFLQDLARAARQIAEGLGLSERAVTKMIARVYAPILMSIELDIPGFSPEVLVDLFRGNVHEGLEAGANAAIEDFQTKKQDLFAAANASMRDNGAIAASGGGTKFFTVPVRDVDGNLVVVVGSAALAVEDVKYDGTRVPFGGVLVDGTAVLPCVGVGETIDTVQSRQVTRQVLRGAAAALGKIDVKSNIAMWWLLHRLAAVARTPGVDAEVAARARDLMVILLRKSLPRVQKELYRHMLEQNAPNGDWKVDIKKAVGCADPLSAYRAICLAVGDDLDRAQAKHHGNVEPMRPEGLRVVQVTSDGLEYECVITYEPLEDIGGFTMPGSTQMVSEAALGDIIDRGLPCPFTNQRHVPLADYVRVPPLDPATRRIPLVADELAEKLAPTVGHVGRYTKHAIFSRATVGSGKTTTREAVIRQIDALNAAGTKVQLTVVSMDDVRRKGGHRREIVEAIKKFVAAPGDDGAVRVLYVDLCNEDPLDGKLFGVALPPDVQVVEFFAGTGLPVTLAKRTAEQVRTEMGERAFEDFLHWSLRNVVSRPPMTRESNFCLNPTNAGKTIEEGRAKCLEVHQLKARRLYNKVIKELDETRAAAYNPPSPAKVAAELMQLVFGRRVAPLAEAGQVPAQAPVRVQQYAAAAAPAAADPAAAAPARSEHAAGGTVFAVTGKSALGGAASIEAHLRSLMKPGAAIYVCTDKNQVSQKYAEFAANPARYNKALVLLRCKLPKNVNHKAVPAAQERLRVFVGDADEPDLTALTQAHSKSRFA